ncbi:choice-of-anchor B family protein [uncultured Dokdonia sp.]|uniref:choice-of-anchor B family protein n=1 Tax=uncultured Dokdonia sp. TaxID=575653 RepID=UPI002607A28E|nr:choice-of-anchor B family protein [uncultured Dokdonia sp.]
MKITSYILILALLILSCKDDDATGLPEPEAPTTPEQVVTDILVRTPCDGGMANIYPCSNYDLMSHLSQETIGEPGFNDIWGWTDASTSREYALLGGQASTVFIDITNAESPTIIGKLPTASINSRWRDIKVYNNHAFIVSEAANHGMQVFDLTRLRNAQNTPVTFDADALYTDIGNAHNIVINEDSGFAYVVGTETFLGGPHFIDISTPFAPIAAGGYEGSGYTHDAQVVTYNGPDMDYVGREILLASNEDVVVIADVTDKENPQLISTVSQDNVGYIHQGWFDESHTIYYANDEFDETEFGFNTRTLVFDLTDLDNPVYTGPYFGPTQAIDHNLYVKDSDLYLTNYTTGLRIADISGSSLESITDIGSFDTHPENDATEFSGAWSVYPYFDSGNIIISDITRGLFIIRKSGT